MKAVHRVLHGVDLESDTFFELCKIDLKTVSPGTTRIISAKDVFKNVQALSEPEQVRIERTANRIEGMSCPVG